MPSTEFVAFNVLTVPEPMRETLEARFAARAGEVEQVDGFRHFELLRPNGGTDRYLVYTRWASRSHFEAWLSSMEFEEGHAQGGASGQGGADAQGEGAARPAASGSELWTFEVVESADGPAGA